MSIFGFGKRKKVPEPAGPDDLPEKMVKTRSRFRDGLLDFFLGSKPIDDELLDEIETHLLTADVGIAATDRVMQALKLSVARSQTNDARALYQLLRDELVELLQPCQQSLQLPADVRPFMLLVVGVNGAGKTTTIGKMARHLQQDGLSVILAAGDTFRAAAVEQLQTWGQRNRIPVIAQPTGADSASVIYDALQAARSRNADVLIADTAGRLHTQSGLMDELKKVKRVAGKLDPSAPHETLLVIDGGTGQNALNQAQQFHQAVGLTGLAVTKLDGTAKGGILFAIAEEMKLPIRFIGVGEGLEDLRVFNAAEFVDAMLGDLASR